MLFDNSCGLSHADCGELLEGVGEIVSKVADQSEKTRVQTMSFTENGPPEMLVSFTDDQLQSDPVKYVQFVRQYGQCTLGGNGQTDLGRALKDAVLYFDDDDSRIDKIIVVSACQDTDSRLCHKVAPHLDAKGVDLYAVNLVRGSKASNAIKRVSTAQDYLLCAADDDPKRVCPGNNGKGIDAEEFTDIIHDCLLPGICEPPTGAPTIDPTPWPTPSPSPSPTESPTPSPSSKPTRWPSPAPSPSPTESPTPDPTSAPNPKHCIASVQ